MTGFTSQITNVTNAYKENLTTTHKLNAKSKAHVMKDHEIKINDKKSIKEQVSRARRIFSSIPIFNWFVDKSVTNRKKTLANKNAQIIEKALEKKYPEAWTKTTRNLFTKFMKETEKTVLSNEKLDATKQKLLEGKITEIEAKMQKEFAKNLNEKINKLVNPGKHDLTDRSEVGLLKTKILSIRKDIADLKKPLTEEKFNAKKAQITRFLNDLNEQIEKANKVIESQRNDLENFLVSLKNIKYKNEMETMLQSLNRQEGGEEIEVEVEEKEIKTSSEKKKEEIKPITWEQFNTNIENLRETKYTKSTLRTIGNFVAPLFWRDNPTHFKNTQRKSANTLLNQLRKGIENETGKLSGPEQKSWDHFAKNIREKVVIAPKEGEAIKESMKSKGEIKSHIEEFETIKNEAKNRAEGNKQANIMDLTKGKIRNAQSPEVLLKAKIASFTFDLENLANKTGENFKTIETNIRADITSLQEAYQDIGPPQTTEDGKILLSLKNQNFAEIVENEIELIKKTKNFNDKITELENRTITTTEHMATYSEKTAKGLSEMRNDNLALENEYHEIKNRKSAFQIETNLNKTAGQTILRDRKVIDNSIKQSFEKMGIPDRMKAMRTELEGEIKDEKAKEETEKKANALLQELRSEKNKVFAEFTKPMIKDLEELMRSHNIAKTEEQIEEEKKE